MKTVIRVMESLVTMNGWTVTRFDLQSYHVGRDITGYAGHLEIMEESRRLVIRDDGTFEWL